MRADPTDQLLFLGTSDGLPSADRHHASLLLRLGGRTLLLDAGEPCSHTLKGKGIDFNSLDAVIITHTHSDHVGGLPMLLQSMWLEQRTRPLPLWMPRRAIRPLQQWLRTCYLFEELLPFRIRWRALRAVTPIVLGGVRLRVQPSSHLDRTRRQFQSRYPEVGFESFSLLIQNRGRRIVYSADLGQVEDLKPLCAKPVDLLVVELAHFQPETLFRYLQQAPVRRVVVTHLGRAVRAKLKQVRSLARSSLGLRPVRFVKDGSVVQLR